MSVNPNFSIQDQREEPSASFEPSTSSGLSTPFRPKRNQEKNYAIKNVIQKFPTHPEPMLNDIKTLPPPILHHLRIDTYVHTSALPVVTQVPLFVQRAHQPPPLHAIKVQTPPPLHAIKVQTPPPLHAIRVQTPPPLHAIRVQTPPTIRASRHYIKPSIISDDKYNVPPDHMDSDADGNDEYDCHEYIRLLGSQLKDDDLDGRCDKKLKNINDQNMFKLITERGLKTIKKYQSGPIRYE
ncbi:hypothetical protein M427DRAFT_50289 [Gonapodya prolifera JEL478]|uniref:Uncharacterized protein n=1 Tax=Gonapodya prolifera (strain JEL478) TaxID=1344416 RepID=A0A138ZXG2_GONPJ|nr:hypothetical protein M427DRAFT_50289 [Gonapodya prolifera JEL478]|eukprot:KXS08823.1 hypothetical protein M427DRAFT_50289 [Gonapodya prolifera JEL478]